MAEYAKRRPRYAPYRRTPGHLDYDGSAVRRLEQEEVLQPRPLVRPREKVVARPKVRVREAGSVSVFAVVGFLAIGVFSILLLMGYVQLAAISDDVVALRSKLTELRTEEAELRAQYELAYDLSSIEERVTSSGRMIKPQSEQVYYVDLSEPDSVVRFGEDQAVPGLSGLVQSAKRLCSELV
ncbi:MAG: hypothetical protein HFE97_02260 [Oscillospiraceae bacterium]|nr:hypothetical protein [Oscillospiraceae bacterium]